jgi:hypothetical protein
VVEALDAVAKETGKTVPQVALNWLLQRPTVSSVIIGARDEAQLKDNLGAVGWNLTPAQVARLDEASAVTPSYPYWHQRGFARAQPAPGRLSGRSERATIRPVRGRAVAGRRPDAPRPARRRPRTSGRRPRQLQVAHEPGGRGGTANRARHEANRA